LDFRLFLFLYLYIPAQPLCILAFSKFETLFAKIGHKNSIKKSLLQLNSICGFTSSAYPQIMELPSCRKYTPLGSSVIGKRFSNGSAILNWIICLVNGMTGISKFKVSLNVRAHGPALLITIGALYTSFSVITPLTFLPSFVISLTASYICVAPGSFAFFILPFIT